LDEQDMRRMGFLQKAMPFTYMCFIIGSLAIMGFPFLTGFYSKDLILEFAYSRYIINALFIYFLGLMAAICTAIYSIRLLYFVFSQNNTSNSFFIIYHSFSLRNAEGNIAMFLPMFILALASLVLGYLSVDLFVGGGTFV